MITLAGKIVNKISTPDMNGRQFYEADMLIERASGATDSIRLRWDPKEVEIDLDYTDFWKICGNVRSYKGTYTKNVIKVYLRDSEPITDPDVDPYINEFCQTVTVYRMSEQVRTTPNGSRILDIVVSIPRLSGSFDTIRAMVWGGAAVKFLHTVHVGDAINLCGRIQSREYTKIIDGASHEITTCELSVSRWDDLQGGEENE